jgi:hypothetical protein
MPKNLPKKNEPKLEAKSKSPKRHWLNGLNKWLWGGVVVLVIFEALITNNQASGGQQLAALQNQQTSLSTEVDQLDRQVTTAGSLQLVRQQAMDKLGLQPVDKNVLYLHLLAPIGATP